MAAPDPWDAVSTAAPSAKDSDPWDAVSSPVAPHPTPLPASGERVDASNPPASMATGVSDTEPSEIPQPFLQRLALGQDVQKQFARAKAAMDAFGEGFGDRPLGLGPETVQQLRDVGIYRDPATGRGGMLRLANEAVMQPTTALVDAMMRTGNGLLYWAGERTQQFAEDYGLAQEGGEKAKNEVINFGNYLMNNSMAEFGRPHAGPDALHDQTVGTLPKTEDFQTAAKVLDSPAAEKNLQDLWTEKGIHPAEAVHDAQSDAFLSDQLKQPWTNPGYEHLTPTKLPPVQNSPMPEGTPRSELARTGEPHIDAVLERPVTRRVIDNPVVDREHTVPYTAGGSVPLEDPTVFIDHRFPQSFTIDGVTFDPADPFVIHENVEQHTMEVLIKGGMDDQTAYKVAHFEFAEKAEGAWYRAHGIDQAKAEAAYAPFMARIQHEVAGNVPSNLYKRPYPHDTPSAAEHEAIAEPKPNADEIARAKAIMAADRGELDETAQNMRQAGWSKAMDKVDELKESAAKQLDLIGSDLQAGKDPTKRMNYIAQRLRAVARNREIDLDPERITEAAYKHGGKIYTGPLHSDAFKKIEQDTGKPADDIYDQITSEAAAVGKNAHTMGGFVTSRGRFLYRDEANAFAGSGEATQAVGRKLDADNLNRIVPEARGQYANVDVPNLKLPPAEQAVADALHSVETVKQAIASKDPEAVTRTIDWLKADLGRVFAETDKIYSPAGADVTRPENLPPDVPPSIQATSPAGRLAAAGRANMDGLFGVGRNIQYLLDPMATGSNRAMVIAKDTMNTVRRIRWDYMRRDAELTRNFNMERLTRMWNALDEESVLMQDIGGKPGGNLEAMREHMGLATLDPEERAAVEKLMGDSQASWLHAQDVGLVEGDGLPAYAPRMMLNIAVGSHGELGPRALNELGRNVFTRTAQMKHRSYLMAEETEAAAKRLVGDQMAKRGASVAEINEAVAKIEIARNIRTLPLASARLEEAAVWREMINKIEDVGKAAGEPTVAVGYKPDNSFFTIAGNPAFTKWAPDLVQDPVTKSWSARVDQNGNTVFVPKPIYMSNEFRGPMKSILDEGASQNKVVAGAQSLYGAMMTLKGKSMTAILNSPLIHNEVVWSKVAEAAGMREWLGFGLYFRGSRIVKGIKEFEDTGRAQELIERGLNPIGARGSYQDITAMMEEPDIATGYHKSWTGQVLGAVPGLFDEGAGKAVERAIAKTGNVVHNVMLWDRVRDVQFGLADHLSDHLVAKGADRLTADRVAAHFSNIIVGSIPKEAMSAGARATANMFLFSRSFTLGNLSTFKQAAMGLPKPILAQIERDFGMSVDEALRPEAQAAISKTATSIARRKAISTIMLSAGLYYVGNALIQHGFNIAKSNETWGGAIDEEVRGYARRYADLMSDAQKDPFELRHLLGRLSPTYDNEPQKQDRAHVGYDKDGTAIYARNPTGKFGEEMVGYPTQPMSMVRRKLSPLAGGILDILENDKGLGKKIYDENDTSISGDVQTAFAVAKHLVMKHLPEGQIKAGLDLLRGDGDPAVNKLRLFAPMAGFTVSEGAPGGMARGEQLAAKSAFDAKFNLAWPDIRKQVQRGDVEGARQALTDLRVPPAMQKGLIRNAMNPSGALHGRTLHDFYQYSTPEQRDRLERARQ